MPKISIICPLLNEEENIKKSYDELINIVKKLKHFDSYEIIFVNDGSNDLSLKILKQLASTNKNIKIISFTRNFGHEAATTAGINNSVAEATVLIDADLQDPPELILEFEQEYLNGFDIVYGQRKKRLNESCLKKFTSKIFYPLFKKITKIEIPKDTGDFCLLSKRAVNIFNQMPEKSRFVRGLIYWSGLRKKGIFFIRRSRNAGKSKYNYFKLSVFAIENIISFSTMPIYLMLFFSLFIIFGCITGTLIALFMKIFGLVVMTGWTSLIITMLFSSACIMFFLSLIGIYVGKIFEEVKQRPTYLIDEKINFNKSQ